MKCANCGTDLLPNQVQCPNCGNAKEFIQEEVQRKNKPVLFIIIGLAVVALLATIIGVMASRGRGGQVTSAPSATPGPPGNVLSAPQGTPPSGGVMSAPQAAPGPGDTAPQGATKPKPPQDVVDYLAFVKQVEEHRQKLLADTTGALTLATVGGGAESLMGLIDMAMDPDGAEARDPLADVKKELNRQYKNWLNTLEYFDKKAAPAQCREFAGAYRYVVYSEAKAIGEIAVGMNSVDMADSKDMSKLLSRLQKMKKDPSIQKNIDNAADTADTKLGQLVSNYDMEKPFDVPREKQDASIMGF